MIIYKFLISYIYYLISSNIKHHFRYIIHTSNTLLSSHPNHIITNTFPNQVLISNILSSYQFITSIEFKLAYKAQTLHIHNTYMISQDLIHKQIIISYIHPSLYTHLKYKLEFECPNLWSYKYLHHLITSFQISFKTNYKVECPKYIVTSIEMSWYKLSKLKWKNSNITTSWQNMHKSQNK